MTEQRARKLSAQCLDGAATLGDLVELQRGYDLPEASRRPGSVPVIGSAGLTGFHDTAKVRGPGVTLGRSGASFGKVTFVREDFWPHNAALFAKNFKGNDVRYVGYLLESLDFSAHNSGSAQQSLNRNYIYNIPVYRPSLAVQQRIAGVLSAYDDLIENCERRIRVVEEMARALYREWFVNFRYPGHESVPLVDSPLGPMPRGWVVAPLQAGYASVQDGDWIETKDQSGNDYRLLQISNVGQGCFVETGKYRYVSEETFKRLRCTEVRPGDLLVARMPDPIGRGWLVTAMPWRMITAVDVAIIRTTPGRLSSTYLVHAWNDTANLKRIAAQASGTTRLRITRRELAALPFVVPSENLQRQFEDEVSAPAELVLNLQTRAENLRKTRDLLLPRLLSGQLSVEDLP